MSVSSVARFRLFVRDACGSAGIELGFGAATLLAVSMMCFDLYSAVNLGTAGARSTVVIADYVSREIAPDGDDIAALAEYLHEREFDSRASAVYVISAVRRAPGPDPAVLLWSEDRIRLGDATATADLATECAARASQGWRPVLLGPPDEAGVAEGEVVFVVEICARPDQQGWLSSWVLTGDTYHVHVFPIRVSNQTPAAPTFAP